MDCREIWKKIHSHQFGRFLFVGIVNTVFGYTIFVIFLFAGFHYAVAAFLSVVCGAFFNFHTIGRFVFHSEQYALLAKFIAVYAAVYMINILCLFLMESIGINNYTAGAMLLLPVAIVSFLLFKFWVFKKKLS